MLSRLGLTLQRFGKGGVPSAAGFVHLGTARTFSTAAHRLQTSHHPHILKPTLMAEPAEDGGANTVRDVRIRHPPGIISSNDEDGSKMVQLPQKHANYGDLGLVKGFIPTPDFFLRYDRKRETPVPDVFTKGAMGIFEGNLYMPTKSQPAARPNTKPDTVCYGCLKLLRSPKSGQSNLLSHVKVCRGFTPEKLASMGILGPSVDVLCRHQISRG